MRNFLCITCAVLCVAGPAGAATLTFEGLPLGGGEPQPDTVVESGFTIRAGGDGVTSWGEDSVHLDDSGTSFSDWVSFETDRSFRLISMRLIGLGLSSVIWTEMEYLPAPYDNVLVEGYRDGSLAAVSRLTTGFDSGILDFTFGSDFADLDLLRITAVLPGDETWQGYPIECWDAPCGHFSVDEITLAPVPLPPALPLGMAALGMLALVRRYFT